MAIDPEMLEAFATELGELKVQLAAPVEALRANINQPQEFLKFSQIIDRVYGTAMTLDFKAIGEYTGLLKQMCRKCGELQIQRAMPDVLKMMVRCLENFDRLQKSIKKPSELRALKQDIDMEIARAKRLEQEVFAFVKKP